MPKREYQVKVSTRGAAEVDGNVDVQAEIAPGPDGFIAGLGEFGGQRVKPLKGTAESLSWTVTIGESQAGEEFTQHLADLEGRMHVLQRLVRISDRDYSSSDPWRVLATGRLAKIRLHESIGAYHVEIQDERFVERNTRIFTDAIADPDDPDPTDLSQVSVVAGTAERTIYPWAFKENWGRHRGGGERTYEVASVSGNVVTLRLGPIGHPGFELRSQARQVLEEDLWGTVAAAVPDSPNTSATRGDFRTVCANVNGTNRELLATDLVHPDGVGQQREGPGGSPMVVADPLHVVWPTDQPSPGEQVAVFLWAPTHKPTSELPMYLGQGSIFEQPPENLFHLAERIFDGIGLRYDQAAIDKLKNQDGAYPRPYFEITEADQVAGDWLQRRIYLPGRVAPFLNAQGEVRLKSIALPTADEIPDPSTLPTLTPQNLEEHPGWEHGADEQVTAIHFTAKRFHLREPGSFDAGDGPLFEDHEFTREHDRIDELGVHAIDIELPSFADENLVDFIARDIFSRYGDGAIRGDAHGLAELEDKEPGDWALIDVPTYPNPHGSTRGGPRVVQLLERGYSTAGVRIGTLDAGPELQPLSAPTVSVSKAAAPDSDWKLDIAVSNLPAGAGYQVEVAESASEPGPSSGLWEPAVAGFPGGPTTKSWDPAKSDTTYWVRARAVKEGRISSAWSAADSATTDALSAPSGLQIDQDLGCAVRASFVSGEALRETQVLLDGELRGTLGRREREVLVEDLDPATTYDSPGLEVRHLGVAGEPGPSDTLGFTTGGAASGPDPGGILVRGKNVQRVDP